MRGDVLNSIRWDEVNDCGTFQEGDKRRVKLYGKPIKNLEFNNEIEAEQRLYKYYRRTHKGRLLYEDEEEEEEKDERPKIYFSGKTSDKKFEGFRWHIESLIEHFSYPSLEEIERDNKFFLFFHKGISYIIRGDRVIIKDEIKVNPKDYYPEDYKEGDPIPADTINRMIGDKLGIDRKLFKEILNINSDFYCNEKEESYKERVFNPNKEEIMVQIYKNDDEKFANDTSVIFLEKDIRIDGSEYGTLHNDEFSHDDDLAFSIHEEDFDKLIESIKIEKPEVKPNEDKCKVMLYDIRDKLTERQREVFMWIEAAFSIEIGYRKIYNLCHDHGIEYYDLDLYV